MKTVTRFALVLLFFFPFVTLAQQKGVVKGRVFDIKNNEPVPFANVMIWKTTIGTATDEKGYFRIENVPLGFNRLEISSVGYTTKLSEEFMVNTASERTVDVSLEENTVTLEQVIVKVDPFRKTTVSPMSLQRIGIAEIEKNPGGNRDISKVLQSMPGVLSSPAFRNDFIVRGGGPSENRFYLDDVELPNLNHFATQGSSGGVVSIVNVDFVKEVNFYSGAFPANRGNLMSSLLDFRQISGNPDKIKVRGTFGATDFGLSLDGPLAPKTTFILSARRSYLKFLFDMIGLPFLLVYNNLKFKRVTNFSSKSELTILGIGAYDVNNLNKNMEDPDDDQKYMLNYLPESVQWSYTLGATYKYYGKRWNHLFVISRSTLQNEIEKYSRNDKSQPKLMDYTSGETENKFRFEHNRLTRKNIKLNLGAGIEYATYKNKTQRELYTGGTLNDIRYNRHFDFFKWSVFGQVSKSFFLERLSLSFGARVDGNSYTSGMNNPLKQFSPRLSLSYSLTPEWFINASTGRYYQLPSYTTMGYADANGALVNKRNGIKYIATNQYAAGIEYRPGSRTQITLEGFYKTYDKYPVSLQDSIVLANKGTDYVAVGDEPVKSLGEGRASSCHQLDIRVDRSFYFKKWSLILYADIQNIYNHKTKSPDRLVPEEDADGNYRVDPDHPGHYLMRYIKNDTGTLLPSVGIIIDF